MLQAKVGAGPLDKNIVEECQKVMDQNDIDFVPLGLEYLEKLDSAIKSAKSGQASKNDAVVLMTSPVMQLKANAATFKYTLIGNLANVMLSFLESIKEIDEGVIQIVEAHHKTLSAIVIKRMEGDGGPYGKKLEDELKNACKRYFNNKKKAQAANKY